MMNICNSSIPNAAACCCDSSRDYLSLAREGKISKSDADVCIAAERAGFIVYIDFEIKQTKNKILRIIDIKISKTQTT